MGSKDSFAGGGGPIGDDLRQGIDDWLANLPGGPGSAPPEDGSDPSTADTQQMTLPGTGPGSGAKPLSPKAKRVAKTALLFRTSSGAGSKARKGTAAQFPRSATTSARTAGRGAAAAYAYRTGDAEALKEFGLDYEALRANPNVFDVVAQIVAAVCEELPDQIESDEQRHVVAEVSEWVVTVNEGGPAPTPAEIAQETLAVVLTWAYLTTTAAELNTKDLSGPARVAFENEVREACEELASLAEINPTSPTASEFITAVESSLEYLQAVYGGADE